MHYTIIYFYLIAYVINLLLIEIISAVETTLSRYLLIFVKVIYICIRCFLILLIIFTSIE